MSSLDQSPPNLVIGCGYLGRRVAARWLAAGRRVAALTRRNADALAALGIEPVIGDVLDPESLRALPRASTMLYAVGLDRTAGKSMREVYVGGLRNVLDTLPECERFIYVSSTSVYAQRNGEWVDEDSPTKPTEESGKVVLEAEQLLRSRRPDAIILRFGGIYGPGRLLRREQQLFSGEVFTGDAERWLNLIHVDDGADAVLAAEGKEIGGIFNIVDDSPVTRREFYTHLAELLGAPAAKFDHTPEPDSANRRISNRKAREQLMWAPQHPSHIQGLANALKTPPA